MDIPYLDAESVAFRTPWPALLDAMIDGLRHLEPAPLRTVHRVHVATGEERTLMMMPGWDRHGAVGVKLITILPTQAARAGASINGVYVMFAASDGRPLAMCDAATLTARRTAAVVALASERLARIDTRRHLLVGTGRLAREIAAALALVRPACETLIWGRDPSKAAALADDLGAEPVSDLQAACRTADMITTVTSAPEPLITGNDLTPGCHVNLVGAHTPSMRESDATVFSRADLVYVDNLEGARHEAGDIIQAIAEGAMTWGAVAGDLATLWRSEPPPRDASSITIFKSVGSAEQDLAAATLCFSGWS